MGRAIRDHRKDKARGLSPRGFSGTEARAFMEFRFQIISIGPSLDFMYHIYFLRARNLFLTGETYEGMRFLMRRSPYDPEAII
jgi:hypothetical protein